MKRLIPIILLVSLFSFFTASGCSSTSASAAQKKAARPEATAEQAKPKPVFTAKDLKLQTKSSPKKKYSDLSFRQARQEKGATQRSLSNNTGATSRGASNYTRNNPI